jgi:hypothetical protein
VVVDSVDESRDVAALVGADDETPRRRGRGEQGHHAVAAVVLPVPQEVDVADVLGDDGEVFDEPVRLHREPLDGVVDDEQRRPLPSPHHPLAPVQRLRVFPWQHLRKRQSFGSDLISKRNKEAGWRAVSAPEVDDDLHPSGFARGAVGGPRRHAGRVGEPVAEGGAGGRERRGERGHLAEALRGVLAGGERQQPPLLLGHHQRLPLPLLRLRRRRAPPLDLEEIHDLGLHQRELCESDPEFSGHR